MPPTIHHRVDRMYGPDCVFAIVDWRGFLGALAENYATVTGTLTEVDTSYGVGLRVGAAASNVNIDLTSSIPIANSPRSVFMLAYLPTPTPAADHNLYSYGANVASDTTQGVYNDGINATRFGLWGDVDRGTFSTANQWNFVAHTNAGVNGGDNIAYIYTPTSGGVFASGTNAAVAVTTSSNLFLLSLNGAANRCPIGTILQAFMLFNRVLSLAEIVGLREDLLGA